MQILQPNPTIPPDHAPELDLRLCSRSVLEASDGSGRETRARVPRPFTRAYDEYGSPGAEIGAPVAAVGGNHGLLSAGGGCGRCTDG